MEYRLLILLFGIALWLGRDLYAMQGNYYAKCEDGIYSLYFEKFQKQYVANIIESELITAVIDNRPYDLLNFFQNPLKCACLGPTGCIIALFYAHIEGHDHIENFLAHRLEVRQELSMEPEIGVSLAFVLATHYDITSAIDKFFIKPRSLLRIKPFCFRNVLMNAVKENKDELVIRMLSNEIISARLDRSTRTNLQKLASGKPYQESIEKLLLTCV